MGWFNNKKNEVTKKPAQPSLPELPKLPELPALPAPPNMQSNPQYQEQIHQLPSFPNNSLGDKFSQNIIKEAVTGKEEGDEGLDADDFDEDEEMQMMPRPSIKNTGMNTHFPKTTFPSSDSGVEKVHYKVNGATKEAEPIFVRIDKFEDSLEVFEKTKDKISEINDMLREIKKLKDDEEKELASWEKEIQIVKSQIEKIDRELFSRL